MKKVLTACIASLVSTMVFAQDASIKEIQNIATQDVITDESKVDNKGWKKGGLINVSLTQVGNSNWVAAGGDKFSLSATASLNLYACRIWKNKRWDNILDVNYALVNTTTLGVRKVNDRLDLISRYNIQPKGWKKVSLALHGQFRSQLSNGFDYDYFGSGQKRRNSGFFAPAYITVAPGIDYRPKDWLTAYISPIAARWTIVSNGPYSFAAQGGVFEGNKETPLATLYGVEPEKQHRGELGAFFTATARKNILKNVQYIGRLDLYSNYLKKAQNVDLLMTNSFQMKVNKWLLVSYNLDFLYDDDIKQKQIDPLITPNSVGMQILSTLGVGFAAKL